MGAAVVGISGSPSAQARSRIIVDEIVRRIGAETGLTTQLIDLHEVSAESLLGRQQDGTLARHIETVTRAQIVVVGTPVYRASYTGLLKVFFDLFPQAGLRGVTVGLVATGGGSAHALVIDHALRPLIASLQGLSAANGLYVQDSQFPDKTQLPAALAEPIEHLAQELISLNQRKALA